MTTENSQQRVAWPVAFGEGPRKGSRAMAQLLNFTLQPLSIEINLAYEQDAERIEFVQALFVDNSTNPSALIATFAGTGQVIKVPAGYQGYIPALATADNCRVVFTTPYAVSVPIQFLSFPVPLMLWPSNAGSTGTSYSANAPVLLANLIATVPVNGNRCHLEVQNQSAVTMQVVQDDGVGGNVTIILLAPGSGANTQGATWTDNYFKGRVRIFSVNTSDQVMVRED